NLAHTPFNALIILLFNLTYVKYFKLKYNLFASVRQFMLLAYVVAIHPMIEITGVLAKGIKKSCFNTTL
ncbi:hypothetical protein, partial [Clostridium perfringens]|uniref:hypothetical protein n=1 Tax=Clostridium perfringens TaxID=1502 RepID=UPI002ACC0E4A